MNCVCIPRSNPELEPHSGVLLIPRSWGPTTEQLCVEPWGEGVDLSHPGWLSSERETTLGAPFKHSPPTPSWGCLLHNSLLL